MKEMFKYILQTLTALFLAGCTASKQVDDFRFEFPDNTVAAEVGPIGKKITIKDVKAAAEMLPDDMRQVPFEDIYSILLRQAIDFAILEFEAKKEGFDKKDEVKKAIKEKQKANLFAAYLEKEVESIFPESIKSTGEHRKKMMNEFSIDIVKKMKAEAGIKLFNLEGKEIPERTEEELKKQLEEAPPSVDASKLSPDFVCAELKGGKVTLKDVKESYDSIPEVLKSIPFEKIYELVLTRVVTDKVLGAAAEKSGLEKDVKVVEQNAIDARLIVQEAYIKSKAESLISKAEYHKVMNKSSAKMELTNKKALVVMKNLRTKYKVKYFDLPKLPTGAQIEKMRQEISSKMNQETENGNLDKLMPKE